MPEATVKKKKIALVVGARPNFIKIAPVLKHLKGRKIFEPILVHTGQHYDDEMSRTFFRDLQIPSPDINLGVGSGSHAEQTGRIMIEFEKVCLKERPEIVLVVGDVNSTVACALVAVKLFIPVAHVEAGLRSFDRTMPEEINRIMTDQISDYLFTTCENASKNLISEGIPRRKIYFVGNTMIDSLLEHVQFAQSSGILDKLRLRRDGCLSNYAVLTLHRPPNVDDPFVIKKIFGALNEIALRIPVIFPVHPRTRSRIQKFGLNRLINYIDINGTEAAHLSKLTGNENVSKRMLAVPPLGYLDFLCLMSKAALVITDSGGIQEETTILGVPCLTLRNNTERPVTVREGTNFVVGNAPRKIKEKAFDILENGIRRRRVPKYWDGKAAERIVKILAKLS